MAERGTMYQLRNLIRRTNVPSVPHNNMNAAEDYLLLLLHTHVVAAVNTVMKFNPQTSVHDLARSIIINYMRLPQVYVYATHLVSYGMDSMIQSRKEMGIEF